MKLDMHVHSKYSKDSVVPLEKIMKAIKAKGLDGFALTDHDTIAGHKEAEELAKKYKLFLVKGVEWKTDKGDILVYDVSSLPKTRDFFKSIDFFKKQKCRIAIAHPFDYIRIREALCDTELLKSVKDKIDFIELNGRCLPIFNKHTKRFAKENNIKMIAGSDAHTPKEYGNCYTEFGKNWIVKRVHLKESYSSIVNLLKGVVIFIWKKIFKRGKNSLDKRD